MKNFYKVLIVSLSLILSVNFAKASHVAGADITYQCLGNNQYVVTLNVFRDCFGTTLGTTASVDFESDCGDFFNVSLPSVSVLEVSQLCPSALPNSDCGSGGFPGMEHHIYQDTITIAPPCDNWTISWELCCRNAQIDNLTNPDTYSLYVESEMYSQTDTCNSSPYFTAQPIPYVCVNQPVTYNFGVVEVDGDSLSFSLIDALDAAGVTIPYAGTYSANSPTPFSAAPNALTLDPGTGLLSFTPNLTGVYVITIQVTEWDEDDNILSTIMRDIQVVVENCVNDVPPPTAGVIQNLSGVVTQIDDYTIELCDGNTFSFDVEVADSNGTDSVSLMSNITQVFPGASFTTNGGNPATATISWTATGGNSYFNSFVIYANDNACPIPGIQTYVYTVLINKSTVASEDVVVLCGPQTANLSVEGGDNFVWYALPGGDTINVGVNFGCDTCSTTWVDPDSTTYYEVVSDLSTLGCKNRDTVRVSVVADFDYTMAQSDTNVCLYGDVDFTVTPDTVAGFHYTWTPSAFFLPGDTVNSVEGIIYYPDTSDVIFVVESDWGCVKTDTFTVIASQNVQPIMSIIGDTTICIGDSTQLFATNGVSYDCEYSFEMFDSFGDGWNGNYIDILENGTVIGQIGDPNGNGFNTGSGPETQTILVTAGSTLEFVWNDGAFVSECSYNVYDGSGSLAFNADYSGGGPGTGTTVYTGTASCGITDASIVYTWTPSAWLSQDSITNPWAMPLVDTTYTVVALDTIGGCSDTASINVYLVQSFTNTLAQTDSSICLEDSALFSVTPDIPGTYTYAWGPDPIYSDDTLSNPTAGFYVDGVNVLNVSVTNEFGCTKIEEFMITVSPNKAPIISVSGDTTICMGDSVQIYAINSSTYDCTYQLDMFDSFGDGWNGAAFDVYINGALDTSLTLDAGSMDSAFFPVTSGDDIEIIFTSGFFPTEESFILYDGTGAIVFQDGQSGAGPANGSVYTGTINCGGGNPAILSYLWSPSSWLTNDTVPDPWVFPQGDTTYTVIAYDPIGGCSDVETVNVFMVDSFSVELYLSDSAICRYGTFEMSATPSGDTTYTFTWTPSDFLSNPNDSAVVADTVSSFGWLTYVVEVANPVGCERYDTIRVQVSEGAQPILSITGDSTLCAGDTSQLFPVFAANTPITCNYCLNMYDDFGDGWNGSYLQLWVDGSILQDSLFAQAPWGNGDSAVNVCFSISEGSSIELVFVSNSFFDDEISYYFISPLGDTLYSDGENGTTPTAGSVYSSLANCGSVSFPSLVYDWSPTSSIIDPNSEIASIHPTTMTTYTLIAIDSIGGCGDTASYNVYVVPSFTPQVYASDPSICLLEDVTFNISTTPAPVTTYTYTWENSPYLASTNGQTNTANNIDQSGNVTFNYTVSSPEGCEKEGVATVLVSTGIVPDIIVFDDTICNGNNIVLDPSMNGLSMTGDSCQLTLEMYDSFGDGWNGAQLSVFINGVNSYNFTFNIGTDSVATFMVGVDDSVCLDHTNGFFPTEETYLLYNQNNDLQFGDGVNIDGIAPDQGQVWCGYQLCGLHDGTYTYDWSPSGTLTVDDNKYTVATPDQTTTYQLIATDTVGFCADTGLFTIVVIDEPEPQVTNPGTFCTYDDTTNIIVDIQGGTWAGSGITNPTTGAFFPGDAIIGNNTVNYSITIAGCTGDTTFNIVVYDIPGSPNVIIGGPYCAASQLNGISGTGSGGTLTWYEYDQSTAIDTGLTPDLGMAMETDTFYVNETTDGCVGPFTSVPFIVIPQPQVGFSATPEQGYIPFEVIFTNTSDLSDSLDFVWDFGNGSSSTDQDPSSIMYTATGDYVVVLIGTDANGCSASDSLIIDADDIAFIPVVFSPNGDGYNDEFGVTGIPSDNFECIIYNRWGTKVYELSDVNDTWDGGNHPDGTYFVVIRYTDWSGQSQQFDSYITKISQ